MEVLLFDNGEITGEAGPQDNGIPFPAITQIAILDLLLSATSSTRLDLFTQNIS